MLACTVLTACANLMARATTPQLRKPCVCGNMTLFIKKRVTCGYCKPPPKEQHSTPCVAQAICTMLTVYLPRTATRCGSVPPPPVPRSVNRCVACSPTDPQFSRQCPQGTFNDKWTRESACSGTPCSRTGQYTRTGPGASSNTPDATQCIGGANGASCNVNDGCASGYCTGWGGTCQVRRRAWASASLVAHCAFTPPSSPFRTPGQEV